MKKYDLKIAQEGFAAGPVFVMPGQEASSEEGSKDAGEELSAFDDAVSVLKRELASASEKAGKEDSAIYEAESLLLSDERFDGAVRDLINSGRASASSAVASVGNGLSREMEENENEYIRKRSEDVRGITERLLGILSGESEHAPKEASVIVAEELSPAVLSGIDRDMILGVMTAKGSPASHVSIICGNLEVPYVYGSEEAVKEASTAGRAIISGAELRLDPEETEYSGAVKRMEEKKEEAKKLRDEEASSASLTRTRVYANIAGVKDIDGLLESGAEGVGLFRSEFLFLGRDDAPSEEEQFKAYKAVAEAMEGKETVIRTMDLGSDKKVDWLGLPDEKNPALGLRGVRVSIKEKDLFRDQLRALLRAAAFGNVRVMVPMIASPWEVEAVRERMEECAKELSDEGAGYRMPPLGIMVETPAAAVTADRLAEIVDFFSIGTNDLTQYTLALDREAEGMDEYYDPCHEAILRLIRMTCEAGHKHGVTTAVCGELAGNPKAVPELIKAGVDELSVSVSKVVKTRALAAKAEEELFGGKSEEPRSKEAPEEVSRLSEDKRRGAERAERPLSVASPADGKLVPMEEIPDKAFSRGTLGECVGIMPDNGTVRAPADGKVLFVAETGHAVTMETKDGRKVMIHAGLDTVKLGGKGFKTFVGSGDDVKEGDRIIEMDLDVVKDAGLSTMIIVVSLND